MKREIKIILDPDKSHSQKGKFFEDLVRRIFETQRYDIAKRVNFTGMEIDLIAKHKDRSETAYIECKAREKLESNGIRVFESNVRFRKADYGYFCIHSKKYGKSIPRVETTVQSYTKLSKPECQLPLIT